MQGAIEELVRWIGWAALRLLTIGRYRGGTAQDRLAEGAVGLGIILLGAFLVHAASA